MQFFESHAAKSRGTWNIRFDFPKTIIQMNQNEGYPISIDDSKSVIWERQYFFFFQFDTRESLLVPLKLHIVLVLGDQQFSGSLGCGFYQNVKVGDN